MNPTRMNHKALSSSMHMSLADIISPSRPRISVFANTQKYSAATSSGLPIPPLVSRFFFDNILVGYNGIPELFRESTFRTYSKVIYLWSIPLQEAMPRFSKIPTVILNITRTTLGPWCSKYLITRKVIFLVFFLLATWALSISTWITA